ncbi:MAG: cytochrome c biogenesis protein CcdA, partial [Planctomycetota bacterium]
MRGRSLRFWFLAISLAGLSLAASPLSAQLIGQLGGGLGGQGFEQETVVTVEGQFTDPKDGSPAHLFVTAKLAPGWHIYSITQAPGGPKRTKIKLDSSKAYQRVGDFRAVSAPERKREEIWGDPNLVIESHHDSVTWYAPIKLAKNADPASLRITGQVYAQACSTACLMPQDYAFTAVLGEGMEIPPDAGDVPRSGQPLDVGRLLMQLGLAFLGGLVLNLMPCVLPVISLKILSFLEQAGESRARVFALNVWYAAGLLSVFMVLALLTASAGHAWGEQFTLPWFKVSLTCLVFVMALSFLGVWEIPIPGFVGRGQAGRLQAREGASGAFFKGVFATILATPCSGPLLGPLFGFLLDQPTYVIYLIYGTIGLGMAFPYLLIGAYPQLIRFLPKPG